jgi:hypothetical protein
VSEDRLGAGPQSEQRPVLWLGVFALLAAVVGACAAVFWANVVRMPEYHIIEDGSATISERALAQVVDADVWFLNCGLVAGAGLGLVAWRWFLGQPYRTPFIASAGALVSGTVCWLVGRLTGPGSFVERLAGAKPADIVPQSLDLRSVAALFVWPLAALVPLLLVGVVSLASGLVHKWQGRASAPAAAEVEAFPGDGLESES